MDIWLGAGIHFPGCFACWCTSNSLIVPVHVHPSLGQTAAKASTSLRAALSGKACMEKRRLLSVVVWFVSTVTVWMGLCFKGSIYWGSGYLEHTFLSCPQFAARVVIWGTKNYSCSIFCLHWRVIEQSQSFYVVLALYSEKQTIMLQCWLSGFRSRKMLALHTWNQKYQTWPNSSLNERPDITVKQHYVTYLKRTASKSFGCTVS